MSIVNNTLQLFLCRARTSLHDTQILLNGSARLGNQPVNNRTTPHWVVDRHRTLIHLPAAYTIILRLVTLAEQPTQSIFRDLAISKRSSIMQAATFEQQMGGDKLPTHMLEQLLQLLGVLIQLQKRLEHLIFRCDWQRVQLQYATQVIGTKSVPDARVETSKGQTQTCQRVMNN